jgi:ubiquinone/menaquinone biosynthesis C-methylase UbiE
VSSYRDDGEEFDPDRVEKKNSEFWEEMCGSVAFQNLGLNEISSASLKEFDHWYFQTYPYLEAWLAPQILGSKRILEVGLGFGSVGQLLATWCPGYLGVDIAEGPVRLMSYRLRASEYKGNSVVSSVLHLPVQSDSQDVVVAIGSLHHVGDFEGSLREIARVLRPGGTLCGMVYAAYSFRSFIRDPKTMILSILRSHRDPGRIADSSKLRRAADVDSKGRPAPFTEFFSKRSLKDALGENFEVIRVSRRNASGQSLGGPRLRRLLLLPVLRPMLSTDFYFVARLKY